MGAFAIACVAMVGFWRGLFLAVNIGAFGYYGFDKFRAVCHGRRVPEVVLLSFAAVGGVPGSLLGQVVFRHKTAKRRFRRVFWAIAIVQAVLLAGLVIHRSGRW
jgi:uncharacterized membrane protein YsdA (DUF1294 family)